MQFIINIENKYLNVQLDINIKNEQALVEIRMRRD